MKYLYTKLRLYPISLLLVMAVVYLSFFTPPHTKLDHVIGIDKLVHLGMYFVLSSCILFEYYFDKKIRPRRSEISWPKIIVGAVVLPILFSCAIEILQEYCTDGRRSGEWLDAVANATGVLLSYIIARLYLKSA